MVRMRETPASHARRRAVSGVIGPVSSSSERLPSLPWRLCRSTVTTTWGRSPATCGLSERSQVAPAELHQGIRTPLGALRVLRPIPGPGVLDGTERHQEALSGLRVHRPVDPDRALDRGGDVEVAALPLAPGPLLGSCGIRCLAPVGDRHPELPGRQGPPRHPRASPPPHRRPQVPPAGHPRAVPRPRRRAHPHPGLGRSPASFGAPWRASPAGRHDRSPDAHGPRARTPPRGDRRRPRHLCAPPRPGDGSARPPAPARRAPARPAPRPAPPRRQPPGPPTAAHPGPIATCSRERR